MTSDSTPAFEIEKEALKTEIETGIQAGVDHLEAKTAKRKDADKWRGWPGPWAFRCRGSGGHGPERGPCGGRKHLPAGG